MKKLTTISLVLLLAVLFCAPAAIAGTSLKLDKETYLKAGTKLVYAIERDGKKYDLNIQILGLTPDVRFRWDMTAPMNKNGIMTLMPDARESAGGIITNLGEGMVNLHDLTAIWLSNTLMDKIKNAGGILMTVDGNALACKVMHDTPSPLQVLIDGKDAQLSTITIHNGMTDATKKTITVLDSKDFPIIVQMNMGWTMTLKSITN